MSTLFGMDEWGQEDFSSLSVQGVNRQLIELYPNGVNELIAVRPYGTCSYTPRVPAFDQ